MCVRTRLLTHDIYDKPVHSMSLSRLLCCMFNLHKFYMLALCMYTNVHRFRAVVSKHIDKCSEMVYNLIMESTKGAIKKTKNRRKIK